MTPLERLEVPRRNKNELGYRRAIEINRISLEWFVMMLKGLRSMMEQFQEVSPD